jgi:hypothetical protein
MRVCRLPSSSVKPGVETLALESVPGFERIQQCVLTVLAHGQRTGPFFGEAQIWCEAVSQGLFQPVFDQDRKAHAAQSSLCSGLLEHDWIKDDGDSRFHGRFYRRTCMNWIWIDQSRLYGGSGSETL